MQMFSVCRASQAPVYSNYVFATLSLLLRLFQIKAQGVSVVAQHSFSERVKNALQSRDLFTLIWQVLRGARAHSIDQNWHCKSEYVGIFYAHFYRNRITKGFFQFQC